MLDYGRAGPWSRTRSEEVRRGRTMSGQARVRIINHESRANFMCVVKVEKPWGLRSWPRNN